MSNLLEDLEQGFLDLYKKYSDSPVISGLISFVLKLPFFSIATTPISEAIKTQFNNMLLERNQIFFNEIEKHKKLLTEETIQSKEFIHKFMITYRAALRTHRKVKIESFGKLFTKSENEKEPVSIDLYEDYLSIIEDLSYREFLTLNTLNFYEEKHPEADIDDYWNEFKVDLIKTIEISESEINPFMKRLERTGCYKSSFLESSWGGSKERGILTEVYKNIIDLISKES